MTQSDHRRYANDQTQELRKLTVDQMLRSEPETTDEQLKHTLGRIEDIMGNISIMAGGILVASGLGLITQVIVAILNLVRR